MVSIIILNKLLGVCIGEGRTVRPLYAAYLNVLHGTPYDAKGLLLVYSGVTPGGLRFPEIQPRLIACKEMPYSL